MNDTFKFADRTEYIKDLRLQNIEREIEQIKKEIRELQQLFISKGVK